jgi:ABC-type Fe3+-siderophore transport system permease subunit
LTQHKIKVVYIMTPRVLGGATIGGGLFLHVFILEKYFQNLLFRATGPEEFKFT